MSNKKSERLQENQAIVFCTTTDSFRLMPENFLLARHNGHVWQTEFDLGTPLNVVLLVSVAFHNHDVKYANDPLQILARITGKEVRAVVNDQCVDDACYFLSGVTK